MPFGTPQGPAQSQGKVTANSTARSATTRSPSMWRCPPTPPGTDDMAGIVQKSLGLLDVSPDFQVTIATRTYSHVERIRLTA